MKKTLAIVVPGIGYSLDRPLLYYSKKIAVSKGVEIIPITYEEKICFDKDIKSERESAFAAYFNQMERQLAHARFDEYDKIMFISKSIGTYLSAKYMDKYNIHTSCNIVYTPLEETFNYELGKGICVSGTKDPWLEYSIYSQNISNTELKSLVIEDGNHSLETGNIEKDIMILKRVMDETERAIEKLI